MRKEIKRLTKLSKKQIPVEEVGGMFDLYLTKESRVRKIEESSDKISKQELALIYRNWESFARRKKSFETKALNMAKKNSLEALSVMKENFNFLYLSAISGHQIRNEIFPMIIEGPPETASIPDYESPDGDYEDKTKVFVESGAEYVEKETLTKK